MIARVLLLSLPAALALSRTTPPVVGRDRRVPLDVLRASRVAKDVRRAETAWRRGWAAAPPDGAACDVALRALGDVGEGRRVESLLRALARESRPYSASAAVSALAAAGLREAARARLDDEAARGAWPDVVALGLAGDAATAAAAGAPRLASNFAACGPACAALFAAQRRGYVDFHGLDAARATLALDLVLDDAGDRGGRAPAFAGPSLLVVTGRGAHSPGGASTVRADVHRVLEARGVPFDVANDGAVEIPLPD